MSTSITNVNQSFTDIDMNFGINPITGDVNMKVDADAVKQSLITLVMMNPYEVPYHPEISSQVNGLLFELDSPFNQATIRATVIAVINKFEPRVQLQQVIVTPVQPSNYNIQIVFTIIGSGIVYQVSTLLQRSL